MITSYQQINAQEIVKLPLERLCNQKYSKFNIGNEQSMQEGIDNDI